MHGIPPEDPGRVIDWSRTSKDYAEHRPGPPDSYYARLLALGLGRAGQRILDLGTGTGVLARRFARQGARVAGVDIAPGQIAEARRTEGIDFRVAPAEATPFTDGSFDVVTANQCWLYFDRARVVAEVKRLLAPGGRLVTSHVCWLPRVDPIARESERLVLRWNPAWTGADWSGEVPECPEWSKPDFRVAARFVYDEPIPFTREGWRGRIRACRGVGAALEAGIVRRFDEEHDAILRRIAPDRFDVLHRIDAHIFIPAESREHSA